MGAGAGGAGPAEKRLRPCAAQASVLQGPPADANDPCPTAITAFRDLRNRPATLDCFEF